MTTHTTCRLLGAAAASIGVSIALLAASGCAPMVRSHPAAFVAESGGAPITVSRDAEVRLPTGYARTVPARSRWEPTGSVAQGRVYRRVGDIFTIEGRHVHEAYLVIQGPMLKGFYLPAEESFSALETPITLNYGEQP